SFVIAVTAFTLIASRVGGHSRTTQVTWTVDVAPIFASRCATCHTKNGFAPMPLQTFEEARSWTKGIREEVLAGRMPPWPGDRGFGDFSNDASLSATETELIVAWADGGAPLGPPIAFPGGVAQRLVPRSHVTVDVRYRKSAVPQTDASALILYLGPRPARELRHRSVACGTVEFDRPVDVLAVQPRAAGGESIEVVARNRDGEVEPLSVVSRYEPEYPVTFRLRRAAHLPAGGRVDVSSSSRECSANLAYGER